MKHIFKILAFLCFLFPVVFYCMANFFPDFLLSLPRPFSDFRSAPVALWLFIVTPILV